MDNNKNSIGIYFVGLEAKERAIFDRVIAFNVTHGLISHNCEEFQSSDLVISSESAFAQYQGDIDNQKVLIVSNDPACTLGDVQLKRPILITRVMKALESVIDAVKLIKDQDATNEIEDDDNGSNLEKIEVEIDDADIEAINKENLDDDDTNTESDADTSNDTEMELDDVDTVDVDAVDVIEAAEESKAPNEITNDDSPQNDEPEEPHTGHHALIIDDSAAIRKQLELELRDAGITADFAESGEEALEKIEDNQYDLVFLDIIMPGIDGYETCRAMRAKASYKRTPIIMLSGKTSPLDEVQGVIAGATTYLTKPVKSAMLQETLSRVTKWLDNFAVTEKPVNSSETV